MADRLFWNRLGFWAAVAGAAAGILLVSIHVATAPPSPEALAGVAVEAPEFPLSFRLGCGSALLAFAIGVILLLIFKPRRVREKRRR